MPRETLDLLSSLTFVPTNTRCWAILSADALYRYSTFLLPGGRAVSLHVWIYEQLHGPIPRCEHQDRLAERLVVDHICENKRCFNPDHLQLVTRSVNTKLSLLRRLERVRFGKFGRITDPDAYAKTARGKYVLALAGPTASFARTAR